MLKWRGRGGKMAEKPGKHYEIRRKRHIYYYMCEGEKYYELRKK